SSIVILLSHKHTLSAQQTTLDIQIATVIFSRMDDHSPTCMDCSFETLKSRDGILPSLAPDGRRPTSGQREPRRTLSPGRETVAQATVQTCQRLQQVQKCGQAL